MLTLDRRDFIRLHRRSNRHHGIVVYSEDRAIDRLADRIDAALRRHTPLDGLCVKVYQPPMGTQVE